jgi:hypothetical protein
MRLVAEERLECKINSGLVAWKTKRECQDAMPVFLEQKRNLTEKTMFFYESLQFDVKYTNC